MIGKKWGKKRDQGLFMKTTCSNCNTKIKVPLIKYVTVTKIGVAGKHM